MIPPPKSNIICCLWRLKSFWNFFPFAYSKGFQTPQTITFDLGEGIIGICKVRLEFHLGSILGLVGGPKRIFCVKQIISKLFSVSSIISKTQTKEFDFTTVVPQVCFFEEIEDTKKPFRNYLTFNGGQTLANLEDLEAGA